MNNAIEGFDEPLGANAEKVVCFTPMSGLLSQERYLPIRYCPLQVELELVTNSNDAFAPGGTLTNADFELSDVQFKVDLVTLENSLDNEYAQHLLSGKSLPINFSTFTTSSQVIPNLNTTVNVSRALTRLKVSSFHFPLMQEPARRLTTPTILWAVLTTKQKNSPLKFKSALKNCQNIRFVHQLKHSIKFVNL